MKTLSLTTLLVATLFAVGMARAQIYRCGNEYTNRISEAQKGQCKLIEGGNVTVVEGFKPPAARASAATGTPLRMASTAPTAARVESAEQKTRDAEARFILEAELKKAEARHAELSREYNNGEPEKQGGEARNYQKYLDRVADLKSELARNEGDIAGIRRELARLPAAK